MSNRPEKYRLPRIQTPWEPPANGNEENTDRYLLNAIRSLESNKQSNGDFNLSGATEGDILVADGSLVFVPRKTVPFSFGVGTNLSVTGNLIVTGTSALVGAVGVSGNAALGGTLGVSGLTTLGGALSASGAVSAASGVAVSGQVLVLGDADATIPLVTKAHSATHSGNLLECRKSDGTPIFGFGPPKNDYFTDLIFLDNSDGNRVFSMTGDGRVGVGTRPTFNTAFEVNMSGAKTGGNVAVFRDATYRLTVDPHTFSTDSPDFSFGANNAGAAIRLLSPENYVLFATGKRVVINNGGNGVPSCQFLVKIEDSAVVGAVTKAVSAQSVNVAEWWDSSEVANAYISNIFAGGFKPRDAATSTLTTALLLGHNTSGTPAAGFGNEIRFQLKSSTTEDQNAAGIRVGWVTATDASRAASGAIDAYYTTTARECIAWEADSSSAKIGFLGAARAAQQTGGAATAGATYGATEQGMLQAAYDCLRTFGLLT